MKTMKKLVLVLVILGVLGTAVAAFAATGLTPAELAAQLTGKTVEEVVSERSTGKTYGQIANEAGKLDEFKAAMLEQKKANLAQLVEEGKLTQEQADARIARIEENQQNCDGTGNGSGCGLGQGNGGGRGGLGRGQGRGKGLGMGGCSR